MRHLLIVVVALLTPIGVAWPCRPPPPMRSVMVLLTAPDATLPADGAILVTRHDVPANTRAGGDHDVRWVVKDGAGADVKLTVEALGSGIERWIPADPADRDLLIRDDAGTLIATLHQTAAASKTHLAAPKASRFDSTLGRNGALREGVPGGAATLVLGQDPPTGARFLAVAISTGSETMPHSASALPAARRTFDFSTYAHKSCAGGGSAPIFIGQHIAMTWVDDLGRRSDRATVTVRRR